MINTRAAETADRATASRTATTWLVSRHLLVAQAVSAALTSVGKFVPAVAWNATTWRLDIPDASARSSSDRIVVLDDVDDPTALSDMKALVGARRARVLVATSRPPDLYWGAMIEGAGVDDVGLATSVSELAELIDRFESGQVVLDPMARDALARDWVEAVEGQRELALLIGALSPKERVVLEMLAAGRRVPEIGSALKLSEATIRSHVKALRAKLGAETQLAAVAMFMRFRDFSMQSRLVPLPRHGGERVVPDRR